MIRLQLQRVPNTEDTVITVGTVTSPPIVTAFNVTESDIDIPYAELEKLIATLNIGMASVFKGFAELNLKDLAAKDGVANSRIIKAGDPRYKDPANAR